MGALIKHMMLLSIVIVSMFCLLGNDVSRAIEESPLTTEEEQIVTDFHKLFYGHQPFMTTFLGVQSLQYPMDNWIMQEMINELKPDIIIETGTGAGGTALYYATILEKVNPQGKILTIDINPHDPQVLSFQTWKDRVTFIRGSSLDAAIVARIREQCRGKKTLITLDADHARDHVLRELEIYADLVTIGSYIVVQDTHLNGHPNREPHLDGPGPWEAVASFLKKHSEFQPDTSRERFLITQHPGGYLKRMK